MIATSLLAGSLLLVLGCGAEHSAATTGAGSSAARGPSQPVSHTVPPRVEPTHGPEPTTPKGHTDHPRRVRWLSAKPSKDGRSLRITWWSGVEPCTVLDRVTVRETPKRVTVTLWEGPSSKARDVACIAVAVQKVTTVKLKVPLGDRKVVDGARP
ncbi:hypothetical protein ACQPYK_03020 [Streptosporangium sp. CA-135522]|uniref:hypothetical protein n=1 Tax=Streptosporangium sp. CA-135522 TaxID=3240072 RepID=UPI003D93B713